MREVDRRHPEPTLYPGGQRGLVQAFSAWWDRTTFFPAARLATSLMGDQIPPDFIAERRGLMNQDFTKEASLADRPLNLQRVHGAMAWLSDQLQGRRFILGDAPSTADLTAYHTLWFARKNGGAELEAMLPLEPLRGWMDWVAALGHGNRHAMAARKALEVAREATPEPLRIRADGDPSGLKPGQRVAVRADDYARGPVHGTLVAADAEDLVIRHNNELVGTVHIHFPRLGYEVLPT